MAEGSSAAKEGLERLKGEITCPLCLETFGEPKVLPCQHVYCNAPINGMPHLPLLGTGGARVGI